MGASIPRRPIEERFWAKVTKTDDCWYFKWKFPHTQYGGLGVNGNDIEWLHSVGMVGFDSTNIKSSRYSYILHKGPIPKGMYVCHHCDVPNCVNPDHLWVGTVQDNWDDAFRKGRARPVKGGKTKGFLGLKHKEESKTLVSVSKLGKPRSKEVRNKISETRLSLKLKHTEEWKINKSEQMKEWHKKRKLGLLKIL